MKLFSTMILITVLLMMTLTPSQVAAITSPMISTIPVSGTASGGCPITSELDAAMANNTENIRDLIRNNVHPILQQRLYSCSDVPQGSPSGEYNITTQSGVKLLYCDTDRTACNSCSITQGWMRIAYLNMTDPNQNCLPGFRFESRNNLRACGRQGAGCLSTMFKVYGIQYSRVCGKIIGYQFGTTDGFGNAETNPPQLDIDSVYIDGVSLTHGSNPRKHIWTFVAALDEAYSNSKVCPCTNTGVMYTGTVPSFIGQDYFCATGSRNGIMFSRLFSDDPLWDGAGCGPSSTCCSFNNPPWFCKELPQPTSEDIELRLCGLEDHFDEDVPLKLIEIYVQ